MTNPDAVGFTSPRSAEFSLENETDLEPQLEGNAPASAETRRIADGKKAQEIHRQFLKEVLAAVMPVLSSQSPTRLADALDAYWEASFSRREMRKAVETLAAGSDIEAALEPMGRPFFHMIVSELWPIHGENSSAVACAIYKAARATSVSEALQGSRRVADRDVVLAMLNLSD